MPLRQQQDEFLSRYPGDDASVVVHMVADLIKGASGAKISSDPHGFRLGCALHFVVCTTAWIHESLFYKLFKLNSRSACR